MFDLKLELSIPEVFDLMSYIESTMPGVIDSINSCNDCFERASERFRLQSVNAFYEQLKLHALSYKNNH